MKTISLLFLVVFFSKNCHSDLKKQSKNISFEYETLTRGYYNKIIVKQDTLYIIRDASSKNISKSVINKNDWNILLNLLEDIDLDSIEKLKAPTNRRALDAALHANLKIVYKDKIYPSNRFDANNAPVEIEKLIDKIITISNNK